MDLSTPDDADKFELTRPAVVFVCVATAIVGLAEQGLVTLIGALAAAALSFAAGWRNLRTAALLIGLGLIAMWLPTFHSWALATVFGATGGWLVKKSQQRQSGITAQTEQLSTQNQQVAESQLELLKSDEVSRYLLAADLHDQALNDQKALAEALRAHKSDIEPDNYSQVVTKLGAVMTETREIMDRLYPAHLNVLGLSESLDALLSRTCRSAKCKARFRDKSAPLAVDGLNELERIVIYRIVEEAVVNACRHAGAKAVSIDIDSDEMDLIISVRDDGKGMASSLFSEPGRGLKFIMIRADVVGAIVGWSGGLEGKGTTCELRVPLPAAQHETLPA